MLNASMPVRYNRGRYARLFYLFYVFTSEKWPDQGFSKKNRRGLRR